MQRETYFGQLVRSLNVLSGKRQRQTQFTHEKVLFIHKIQGRINQCSNMFGRTGAPTLLGAPHMRRKFFFLSQNCLLVKETAQNKLVESMYIRSFSLELRVGFVGGPPPVPHFPQSVINTGKLFIFETKKRTYLLTYLLNP